jgi:glyoxylase-like metal-dependent hydrolase (beta-lactamase superfamily II)
MAEAARRLFGGGERGGRAGRPICTGVGVPDWVVPLAIPTPYPIGPVTVYLLEGEPLTLIDSGPATRAARRALVEGLAAAGYRVEAVRRLLVTHGHHDHFGQAAWLAKGGVEVFAHPHEARNLRQERAYAILWRQLSLAGLPLLTRLALLAGLLALDTTARPVSRFAELVEGETLQHSRGRIRVHHLPGHSPGHLGFELVDAGIMWTGDTLLEGITPNAVVGPDPEDPTRPFRSLAAYNDSLGKLERSGVGLLLPGHGPCIRDLSAAIASVRQRQDQRSRQIQRLLERGPAPVMALLRPLFPGLPAVETFLAFSEVFGHLLELERRGRVRRRRLGRRELWELVPLGPSSAASG